MDRKADHLVDLKVVRLEDLRVDHSVDLRGVRLVDLKVDHSVGLRGVRLVDRGVDPLEVPMEVQKGQVVTKVASLLYERLVLLEPVQVVQLVVKEEALEHAQIVPA